MKAYDELIKANEARLKSSQAQIVIPPGERLGDLVIEVEGLKKAYGDKLLIDDLSFSLPPGGIVGIIGANGAGKTTLFRMITGQEEPDLHRPGHEPQPDCGHDRPEEQHQPGRQRVAPARHRSRCLPR